MNVEFGNAGQLDTNGSGWFIGFSDWAKSEPGLLRFLPQERELSGLCVKWKLHQQGDPNGEPKPVSSGKTISIMVGHPGSFKLEFCDSPSFLPSESVSFTLAEVGDFVIWGEGVYHRAFGLAASCILTIRWEDLAGIS